MVEDRRCSPGEDEDGSKPEMIQETVGKMTKSIEMNSDGPLRKKDAQEGRTDSAAPLLSFRLSFRARLRMNGRRPTGP